MAKQRWGNLILLCITACASTDGDLARGDLGERDVSGRRDAIVYGDDDRIDAHELDDESLARIVRESLVAVMPSNRLFRPSGGSVQIVADDLATEYGLCDGERFADQPTAADCSGVLIDHDLVLTAGHCIDADMSCGDFLYVFDYETGADGELEPLSSSDVYGCRQVLTRSMSSLIAPTQLDFAVIQLDRPPVGRRPVPISRANVAEGQPLTVMGFPSGLPAKVDLGGRVRGQRNAMRDYFMLDSDTFAGSSGSGVFEVDGDLVGVLVRGGEDYELDREANCYRPNLVPADADGAPWEQATYASKALDALCDRGWPSLALCGIAPRCGDGYCTADEVGGDCAADCGRECDGGGCAKSVLDPLTGDDVVELSNADELASDVHDRTRSLARKPKPKKPGKGCSVGSAGWENAQSAQASWLLLGLGAWLARRRRAAPR